MKASIVLPNLNGAGWLRACINSLYAMTEQDFELIVVDNHSADESLAILRDYAGRPGFALIENSENTGFSAAVNQGIRAAKAPYVLLFNNDAFAKPDMLARLLDCMEQNPRAFSAQCLMLQHQKPELCDNAGDFVTLPGWAFQRGHGLAAARYAGAPRRVFSACGGAALYRKSLLVQNGLFEEAFFAYLEDVDIGWRANSLGFVNLLCPAAVCTHMGSATSAAAEKKAGKYNTFKSIQSGRNSLLLPVKNMPVLMLALNFPFLLLGYLVKTLVFHLRGYGRPWRQGFGQALRLLRKLRRPKFRFKNLPHYFWVQGSLFAGTFRFIAWRLRRLKR